MVYFTVFLQDLFSLQENTTCDTHNLIACGCLSAAGVQQEVSDWCVCVCVCVISVPRTPQEPPPAPSDDPGDVPVSAERCFQLGPAPRGPSFTVGAYQRRNKTMDELLAWEHIPSPLDEDQVNVSLRHHFSCTQHTDTVHMLHVARACCLQ